MARRAQSRLQSRGYGADASGMKMLNLRRPDVCAGCWEDLAAGQRAAWDAATRKVHCVSCWKSRAVTPSAIPVDTRTHQAPVIVPRQPTGGGSAQREYDRRSASREERIRTAHPRLGGVLLALNKEPASTRVWAQGAAGERAVAAKLEEMAGGHVVALHDRALRRPDGTLSRANVDHIAIGATGVWVIDAKTHQGELEVRRSGGLFSPKVEKLYIAGRDRTSLVDGLVRQMRAVRAQLDDVGAEVAVRGALCFVGTELPWFGSSSIAGVPLVGRRGLVKLLKAPGDLAPQDRDVLASYLELRFPPAS